MARPKKMTRAEIISMLKSRGQKGALSKMTKPQLRALLEKTAPPGDGGHDGPRSDLALEPDEQGGGHYFRKNGKTVSDGAHDHKKDPWPSDAAPAKAKKAKKAKKSKKKVPDIEDPDADLTVDLVNRRLLADRHPATGRKISGKKADQMMWLLLDQKATRLMDGDRVTRDDMEQRLDKIDETHRAEFPTDKPPPSGVDPSNILAESAKRGRKKPDRLSEQQPDAFVAERDEDDEQKGKGMGYHAYMSRHLKQHGGNMAKAAAAYREQKGGHYARKDGSIRGKDKGKYGHTHIPGKNPAVKFEDAQEDEPEPERAPSPPARRITRNMDPREARRQQRGRGVSQEEMDEAELERRLAEIKGSGYDQDGSGFFSGLVKDARAVGSDIETAAKDTYNDALKPVGHFIQQHKDAFETAGMIGAAVFLPGVGEVIDAAAGTAELGEAGATVEEGAETIEGAEGASTGGNPASTGDASAEADANASTDGTLTEDEAAGNKKAFKPTSGRSLSKINNQGRTGALKNLVTNADGGATRAQAMYNSRYGLAVAGTDLMQDVIGNDNKDLEGDPPPPPPPGPPAPAPAPAPHVPTFHPQQMHDVSAFGANRSALEDVPNAFGSPWG